jgi:glycosyltransferase involved in cell wall biosynthesis
MAETHGLRGATAKPDAGLDSPVTDVMAARPVGLVAPLPPQVGGVASVAEWLLLHEREINCRYDAFDLWRPADGESGGRFRLSSIVVQARLLGRFVRWLRGAPPLVHYCVSCTRTGLPRDLVFLALARLSGKTTIAHIHSSDLVVLQKSAVRSLGLRGVGRLSAEPVAIAPSLAKILGELGIRSRWILNPIRLEPDGIRSHPPTSRLRLLFVGTYGERKGSFELLEALAQVRAEGVDATLRIVGREERSGEESALQSRAEALQLGAAIEFSGVAGPPELRSFYEQADVICLPSKREGLPMAILEGMAFGLPVLATTVGGIPDVVEDRVSGVLVEPGDVDGLAAGIRLYAAETDQRLAMGAAARSRVLALASPDLIASQWRELYEECGARSNAVIDRSSPANLGPA